LPDQPQTPEELRATALLRLARLQIVAAIGYGLADAAENAGVVGLVGIGDPPWAVSILGALALIKVVLLVATVLPLALVLLARPEPDATRLKALGRQVTALRAQAVTAVLLAGVFAALGGDLGLQIDDAIMRWIEEPRHLATAVVAALLLGWLMVVTGLACCAAYERRPPPKSTVDGQPVDLSLTAVVLLGVAGTVLLVGGLTIALLARYAVGYAAVFPGAALLLFAALSWPAQVRRVQPPAEEPVVGSPLGRWLVWVFAAVPVTVLALVVLRASVTLAVTREPKSLLLVLVAVGFLGTAAALVVRRPTLQPPRWVRRAGPAILVLAALAVTGYAMFWPQSAGWLLGSVALLFLFAACVLLLLTGLHLFGDRRPARGALALIRLRRVPVITLFVLWALVTSLIDRTGHYYDVRLGDRLPTTYRPITVTEAMNTWLTTRQGPTVDGKRQVPMVFVATAGGGIRSAYWTALVLDCLFAAAPREPACAGERLDRSSVFAASGISGGSLGLVVDRALEDTPGGFDRVLGRDLLSPDIAALAFRDLPNSLVRLEPRGQDRAGVMERTWEDAMGRPSPLAQGYFASARHADGTPRFPLLLLNSATVEDGCRLNGSALTAATAVEVGPAPPTGTESCLSLTPFEPGRDQSRPEGAALAGSKDLYDFVCRTQRQPDASVSRPGQPDRYDLAISTAALLSARFPYISPSGALTSCGWPQRRTFALDGGLLESSAVSPLTELWTRIAGQVHQLNQDPASGYCIQPRLLMLDNGYSPAASAGDVTRPQELVAPASGASLFSATRGARAEQSAALAFDHIFGTVTCRGSTGTPVIPERVAAPVAHIVPTARPGPHAPLGWSLSRFAREDLVTQLRSPANLCQVALVRSWFQTPAPNGAARCLTGFVVRTSTTTPAAGPSSVGGITPPIPQAFEGQPGVTVTLSPAGAVLAGRPTAITDASGRFYLIVRADQATQLTLTAQWGGASVDVPAAPGAPAVDTSVNFEVSGPGPR
jgi:hypothetical protein